MNNDNPWGTVPATNWVNSPTPTPAPVIPNPKPSNPWDALNQDQLLMLHLEKQTTLATLKAEELELRKYIVDRAFPQKTEGMNTQDLGNGYKLKAAVKYNYKLADNDTVEKVLDKIASIGNEGKFISERLVSWTPNFLITEYRALQEEKEKQNPTAIAILKEIETMLEITEAAPTLKVEEPKAKKK